MTNPTMVPAALLDAFQEEHRLKIDKLLAEAEQLRVQLAGCGVAAIGYAGPEVKRGDYGHSASFDDVCRLYSHYQALCSGIDAALEQLVTLREPGRSVEFAIEILKSVRNTPDIKRLLAQ